MSRYPDKEYLLSDASQLASLLKESFAPTEDLDISQLRYVLYARKSTRGDERQERSIGDQIAECKRKLPSEIHITEKDIVTEKESAKEPNIRPVFKQMISDIEAGKYDGIIA